MHSLAQAATNEGVVIVRLVPGCQFRLEMVICRHGSTARDLNLKNVAFGLMTDPKNPRRQAGEGDILFNHYRVLQGRRGNLSGFVPGNGDVQVELDDERQIPYAMELVRQAFAGKRQGGTAGGRGDIPAS